MLEVGCGSGGPALHVARVTGCQIVEVDLHEDGVANASRLAREAGLDSRASFVRADASEALPFDDESFGALLCIDTVNHLRPPLPTAPRFSPIGPVCSCQGDGCY